MTWTILHCYETKCLLLHAMLMDYINICHKTICGIKNKIKNYAIVRTICYLHEKIHTVNIKMILDLKYL